MDTLPLDTLPPRYPTPLDTLYPGYPIPRIPYSWIPYPLDTILPPLDTQPPDTLPRYPNSQKGHGTRDTLPFWKEHGTRDTLPPVNRLTDACENITLPQLLLWAVKTG